jgi:phage tail-like protein
MADALVRSPEGRYLWVKLNFLGNGQATPTLEYAEVEFPRISLRRYLPAAFGEEPVSRDFTDRFLSIFDTTIRSVETTIDHLARYFDPISTPSDRKAGKMDFLSWLASWIGISFDRQWPEGTRRRFLRQAGNLFPQRGTVEGLRKQLLIYLGMEPERICCPNDRPKKKCILTPQNCVRIEKLPCFWKPPLLILEHFQLRRWLFLGQGRLHDRAVLWGRKIVNRTQLDNQHAQVGKTKLITRQDPLRDPFHYFAHQFSIFVPAKWKRSDSGRKGLENLLKSESPAHTRYTIEYVEPHFRLGFQSTLGFNTAIGCYPHGLTLDEAKLGQGSILTGPSHFGRDSRISVGKTSIGATTQLS